MAKVKAVVSFAGAALSMYPGEEREIDDKLAASLSEAGHVEILSEKEESSTSEETSEKEEESSTSEETSEKEEESSTSEETSEKEEEPSTSEEAPKKEAKKNEGKRTKRADS